MNFKDLKKSSGGNLSNLVTELEKMKTGGKSYDDPRFWKAPMDDKTGKGTALVRFLPKSADNSLPWVTFFSHAFQGPGGWYIENSLSSIGKTDPCGEANSELWATGIDANKELVRKRKRKQHYVTNILVLADPKNRDNEGKVFLYKFGKKIFQKIQGLMVPDFAEDASVDPFDFWKGANFRLKITKEDGYPNYDSSYFESPSPLLEGDDAALETVWNSQYDLREFLSEKNYKSYDELKARFDRVLGNSAGKPKAKDSESKPSFAQSASKGAKSDVPWSEDADVIPASSGKGRGGTVSEASSNDDDELDSFLKGLSDDE